MCSVRCCRSADGEWVCSVICFPHTLTGSRIVMYNLPHQKIVRSKAKIHNDVISIDRSSPHSIRASQNESFHHNKLKNRNDNNTKINMLRKLPDSCFTMTKTLEDESQIELPATLVKFAPSIRRS